MGNRRLRGSLDQVDQGGGEGGGPSPEVSDDRDMAEERPGTLQQLCIGN